MLEAIWGIQRSNQTTVAAMEKSIQWETWGGGGLRKDLSEKQDQACDKLSQRLKENEKYQFKRKGNELQHAFNEEEKEVLCLTDRHDTIMPIQASFVFAPTLNCNCQWFLVTFLTSDNHIIKSINKVPNNKSIEDIVNDRIYRQIIIILCISSTRYALAIQIWWDRH